MVMRSSSPPVFSGHHRFYENGKTINHGFTIFIFMITSCYDVIMMSLASVVGVISYFPLRSRSAASYSPALGVNNTQAGK